MKKLISAILLATMVGLQVVPAVTFAENSNVSEETEIVVNKSRAAKLRYLGVVYDLEEGEVEDLTKPVSRGEFAKILVKYFNKKGMYQNITQKPYVDVELTDNYVRDIKVIKDLGLVTDTTALMFRPDEIISISDASVMILKGLGYDTADKMQATEVGLYKGINKQIESEAILDDIYAMLENAFKVESTVWAHPQGLVYFDIDKHENVLEQDYNLIEKKGIVTATPKTGMSEASQTVREGHIKIGDEIYPVKEGQYDDLLGYEVKFYVTDDSDSEIAYIEPTNNNRVTVIEAKDINVSGVTESTIPYYKGEKRLKKISLESNVDVIYNERAYSGFGNLKNVMPENGKITVIDNDSDGKAEIIKVEDYRYYLVSSVDAEGNIIYEKVNNTRIDLSDPSAEVVIRNANGKLVTIAGIKKDTVISVSESKNSDGNKFIGIVVSDSTVRSRISAIIDENKVKIDDSEYETTDEFYANAYVDQTGVFYLAHDAKIVFFKPDTADSWEIGVVHRVSSINDNVSITLYNSEGEFVKYTVTEKVKFSRTTDLPDGAKGKEYVSAIVNVGEVIRYQLNSDGAIQKIEVADKGYTDQYGNKQYLSKNGLRLTLSGNSFHYRNKLIDGKCAVRDDTLTFFVPKESSWSDKDKFLVNISYVFNDPGFSYSYPYKVYVYDDCNVSSADIAVFTAEAKETALRDEDPFYTVDSISTVLYDDEPYMYVSLFSRGDKLNYYCTEEYAAEKGLKQGDVIQMVSDDKRRIKSLRKIYNSDRSAEYGAILVPGSKHSLYTYSASYYTNGQMVLGKVVSKDKGYVEFNIATRSGKENEEIYIADLSPCKLTEYDASEKTVSAAQYDDIVIGDEFVALVSSGLMYDMVIIR